MDSWNSNKSNRAMPSSTFTGATTLSQGKNAHLREDGGGENQFSLGVRHQQAQDCPIHDGQKSRAHRETHNSRRNPVEDDVEKSFGISDNKRRGNQHSMLDVPVVHDQQVVGAAADENILFADVSSLSVDALVSRFGNDISALAHIDDQDESFIAFSENIKTSSVPKAPTAGSSSTSTFSSRCGTKATNRRDDETPQHSSYRAVKGQFPAGSSCRSAIVPPYSSRKPLGPYDRPQEKSPTSRQRCKKVDHVAGGKIASVGEDGSSKAMKESSSSSSSAGGAEVELDPSELGFVLGLKLNM
ncbi:unnamed protein product [Amoebophrya sp. A120]|nr:unnamed protein product [Amoebophrya sp. A120]|eukprot:GSA120T00018969001.1